jgi:hypothetical protein
MAISFQQSKGAGATNAGPVTATFDATPAAGDLILVYYVDSSTSDKAPTLTTGGYTDVSDPSSSEQYANGTSDTNARGWYKYSDGTETNVVGADMVGTADGVSIAVMIFRGVASAAQGGPFSTAPVLATPNTTNGNIDPAQIATASGDVVVLMAGAAAAILGTYTAPANYTTSALLGVTGADTTDGVAAMAFRTSGYSNPENPAAWSMSGTSHSSTGITLALKEAPAPQIDGVVLTITPSLPTGLLDHTLTGVVLTATPSLPTGSVGIPGAAAQGPLIWFWATGEAAGQTVTGVALTVTPTLPTGTLDHSLTGVALTVTPSLPVGTLNHSLTGVAVTATPSLPTGALRHSLTGVAITVTPSLPTGALAHTITGVVLTATPSLPVGQVTTPGAQTVTGVVLTITPTLPTGSVTHSITAVALTATPSLPTGTVNRSLTGVVLTVTPTLPTGTVNRSITGVVLTVTPTLPVGQVTVPGSQTVTGIVLTVTPTLPVGTVGVSSVIGIVLTVTPSLPIGLVTAESIGIPVKGPTYGRSLIGDDNAVEALAGAPRAVPIGTGANSLEEV